MGGGGGGEVKPVYVEDDEVVVAAGVQVAAELIVCPTATATGGGGLREGASVGVQVVRGCRPARLEVVQARVQFFQRRCERAVRA